MTVTVTNTSGLTLTRRLGAGGEAEVYAISERPDLAYKRFRSPTAARADKLRVMVANPPEGAGGDRRGTVEMAWPRELVVGGNGTVEGFLMPRIDLTTTVPLFQVYNPASRLQIAPAFTWRYLLRTARNLAAIVDSLHRAGYVVGDINESNLLVDRRALVVLVDCDSMQVRDPTTGVVHHGGVGKPEFTAPELQGVDLSTTDRTPASDVFAVAILVFQLLMEGVHPFAGIWRGGGEPPDIAARIRGGQFPYRRGTQIAPPPRGLDFDVLPPGLRRLAWRTFTTGVRRPGARPAAAEWVEALERADAGLRTCDRSLHHVFGDHQRRCPWCARFDDGLPDPFPGPSGKSGLERRPPPLAVRARTATEAYARNSALALRRRGLAMLRLLATRAGSTARSTGGALFGIVRTRAASSWSRIRPAMMAQVPLALAVSSIGALLPVGGLLFFAARLAGPSLIGGRAIPWVRLASVAGVCVAVALASATMLHQGMPPTRSLAATASALLAFAVRPAVPAGSRRAPIAMASMLWAAALAGLAALALRGPWWWPFA